MGPGSEADACNRTSGNGADTSSSVSTMWPNASSRRARSATRSAEGPMSTPRRLAPRSIGTPVIRIRVRSPPGNARDTAAPAAPHRRRAWLDRTIPCLAHRASAPGHVGASVQSPETEDESIGHGPRDCPDRSQPESSRCVRSRRSRSPQSCSVPAPPSAERTRMTAAPLVAVPHLQRTRYRRRRRPRPVSGSLRRWELVEFAWA